MTSNASGAGGQEQDGVWHDAANTAPETDPIDEQLRRGSADKKPTVHGELRAIESVGAWSGASLVTHLKAPAIASVERETWLAYGAQGASKAGDVDHKTQQRQSLGAGGLMRGGPGGGGAWTLGIWGAL